jgi:uncharacterized protein (DUF849 family)
MQLRPEICSLDMGTMNQGPHLFVNTQGDIAEIARLTRGSAKPELEVFDTGHIMLANHMIERGMLARPAIFQLCLGLSWAAPATPESMMAMRNLLSPGSLWTAFGIGPTQFPMVAQAIVLGGHVRVGLEDNLYLERGVLAQSNAVLVERAVHLIHLLGERVATPAEAREMMGVAQRDAAQ